MFSFKASFSAYIVLNEKSSPAEKGLGFDKVAQ